MEVAAEVFSTNSPDDGDELVASVEVCLQTVTESVKVDEVSSDGVFLNTSRQVVVYDGASVQIICGGTGELVSATDVTFLLVIHRHPKGTGKSLNRGLRPQQHLSPWREMKKGPMLRK